MKTTLRTLYAICLLAMSTAAYANKNWVNCTHDFQVWKIEDGVHSRAQPPSFNEDVDAIYVKVSRKGANFVNTPLSVTKDCDPDLPNFYNLTVRKQLIEGMPESIKQIINDGDYSVTISGRTPKTTTEVARSALRQGGNQMTPAPLTTS